MSKFTVNSPDGLSTLIGELREAFNLKGFLTGSWKSSKARSLPQNAITHAWYSQIAKELREDDEMGWRCYCKLHHGVPILRLDDDDFRTAYDRVIKPMRYEDKLEVMKFWPVTSRMSKDQLSKYAESVKEDFEKRSVFLQFPSDQRWPA